MLAPLLPAWYDGCNRKGRTVIHMRYDTVIFDLDGTLLDTLSDLAAAVNQTMRAFGHPEHSAEAVCSMVGNGIPMLVRRALPPDAEHFEEILSYYKAYYGEHANDHTCPYEGVEEMLQALAAAGVKQAILSNKADPFVKELNARYFSRWIEKAVGEKQEVRPKPWPDSVLAIMQEYGCDPARTLYVGDSEVDVLTAQNAGVDCASVCWGFRTEEQLRKAGAQHLFHHPQELAAFNLEK